MSLLDEALQSSGAAAGLDALTAKVSAGLNRIQQRTQIPVGNSEQVVGGYNVNTAPQANQTYTDQRTLDNAGTTSYLDQQLKAHWDRKEQQKDLWTSDDNLYSTNPFVEAGSNVLNLGKRVASGLGTAFNGIASFSSEAQRNAINASIPEDIQDIARRQDNYINRNSTRSEMRSLENQLKHGQLSTQEMQAIQAKLGDLQSRLNVTPPSKEELAKLDGVSLKHGGRKWIEIIKDRDAMDQNTQAIRGDQSKGIASLTGAENWGNRIADENMQMGVDRRKFTEQADSARENWNQGNYGSAIADTLGSWGTQIKEYGSSALQNPGAVTGMIADSAVYLNPVTRLPASLGLAGEQYARGSQEFRNENNREMTAGEHAGVGALAAAYGGLGYAQGKFEQSAIMGNAAASAANSAKTIAGTITDGIGAVSKATAAKTPYIGGVLDMAIRGAGAVARETTPALGRIAGVAAAEGVVEGIQSVMEQNAGLQGRFNIEETGENIALGAITGGAMTTPGSIAQTGIDLVTSVATKKNETKYGNADVTDEELVDANSKNYNPSQVINREIMKATSIKGDVTPEEITASKEKVDAAYASTKKAYDNSAAVLEAVQDYDNVLANHTAWVERLNAQVEAKRAGGEEAYQAARSFVDNLIAPRQAFIDSVTAAKEGDITALQERVNMDKKAYEDATTSYNQFDQWYKSRLPEQSQEPATATEEVTKILAAPNYGNVQRMQELAQDSSLDEATRNNLRVVSEALIAENKAKSVGDVSKAVMKGVEGYRGLSEYVEQMNVAINTNDVPQQNILKRQLSNFTYSLNSKAEATQAAQAYLDDATRNTENKRLVQVVRNTDGSWEALLDGNVSKKQFDKNNGVVVWARSNKNPNGSQKLVDAIAANAQAANSTKAAVDALFTGKAADTDPVTDFDLALDEFNNNERINGRDTTARDTDPNAVVVDPQNNEGDFVDNSTPQGMDVNEETLNEVSQVPAELSASNSTETTGVEPAAQPESGMEQTTDPQPSTPAKAEQVTEEKAVKPKAVAQAKAEKAKTAVPKATKKQIEPEAKVTAEIQADKATYTESEYEKAKYETVDRTDADSAVLADGSVDSSPAGAITALNTAGKSYKESIAAERKQEIPNLVKAGFVQRLKAGLNSPLVKYNNLLTTLRSNMRGKDVDRVLASFIRKNSNAEASEANVNRVKDFFKFSRDFNTVLQNQLRAKENPNFYFESMLDFIYTTNDQGKKVLDENVATAMSLSAYEWLGNNSNVIAGTTSEIAAKIYMPDAKALPNEVYAALSGVGTYSNEVMKDLGSTVIKALQLKALPDVDADLANKLTMAFGAYTLSALLNAELVQRTDVSLKAIHELQALTQDMNGEEDSGNVLQAPEQGEVYFIRAAVQLDQDNMPVASQYGYEIAPRIQEIAKAKVDASSVLGKIFSHTDEATLPAAEPITSLPSSIDRLGTQVSELQKEVMLKQQATPYVLNTGLTDIYYQLKDIDAAALSEILGFRDPKSGLEIREKAVQSRNEQISRALAFLEQTHNEFADKEFYLPLSVWTNMRSGITSVFNPQADKLHRAFSALASDKITVPHNETRLFNEQGELTQYGMFLRGLAFRLEDAKNMTGVAGSIDKKKYATFLPQLENYINSTEVTDAALALAEIKAGEGTKDSVARVHDLLLKWGNGAAGLSALEAIMQRNAGRAMGEDFTSYIFAESDGSNNGPAITHTMMNTGTREMLNSVGIFFDTDPVTNLVDHRNNDGKDMYEQLAQFKKAMNIAALAENPESILDTINKIDADFDSRSGAKRDLVPFNYGAGMDAVKRASSRAFVEVIYDTLEKAVQAESVDGVDNIVRQVNELIQYYNSSTGNRIPQANSQNMYGKHAKFTDAQIRAIRMVEQEVRGPITEAALQSMLGNYIDTRNRFASISGVAYNLFTSLYNEEMAIELAQYYQDNPKAKKNGENLPTAQRDKIIKRLRRYMPKLDVAMGLHNKQLGSTAIPIVDTAMNWQNKAVRVPFIRRKFPQFRVKDASGLTYVNESKAGNGDVSAAIESFDIAQPGVGAIAKFIQSHDAYVAFRTMDKFKVQNYHDANPINPYQLEEMAKHQNEMFLDAVTTSHIGESFLKALLAPLEAYASGTVTPSKESLNNYQNSMAALKRSFGLDKELDDSLALKQVARTLLGEDVRKMKQIVMAKAINQYGTEGGEYLLTDSKRKQIIQRTDQLIDRSKKLIAKLESTVADIKRLPKQAPKRTQTLAQVKQAELAQMTESGRKPTPAENELWQNRDQLKDPREFVKFVDKMIAQHLSKEGNVGKYANVYRQLLRATQSSLEGLEINIFSDVENTSGIAGYEEALVQDMHAWYVNHNGKRQINLRMGTTHKINSAVLVHELMHAATADALAVMRKDPSKYPKAQQAYANLESLYAHVKSQVQDGDSMLVKYGVSNIDEFVATGLTYPEFMQYLDKIKSVPKAKGRGLSALKPGSLLRSLVDNVVGVMREVFGRGNTAFNSKTATAYESLVLDVAHFLQNTTNLEKDSNSENMLLLGAPAGKALDAVTEMTAVQVYDSLNSEGLDPGFDGQVRKIMAQVSDKVFTRLPKTYKGNGPYSPENIWNHALETGDAPYQSPAIQAGFRLSDREQFAVEALELTLDATTQDKSLTTVMKELEVIYSNALDKLKPEHFVDTDWAVASAEQKAVAQAKYNYLFDSKNKNYLPRFMALALGSAEVNALLGFDVNKKGVLKSDKELFAKVFKYVDRAVDSLVNKHLDTRSTKANSRLNAIALKFVDLDNKNRNKAVAVVEDVMSKYDYFSNYAIKQALGKAADVTLALQPESQTGKIIRNTVGATLGGKPMEVFSVFAGIHNQALPNQTLGFMGELNKEVGNVTQEQRTAEALIREQKVHETNAQRLRTEIKNDLLSMFKEGGVNLDRAAREAITAGLLRTDIQSLAGTYSMDRIADLIKSPAALKAEIAKLSQGVSSTHLARTRMLGWYMVSGIGHNLLAKNAHAIAAGAGFGTPTRNVKAPYVKQLDQLATLYALQYTSSDKLQTLSKVIEQEKDGKKYNGIEAVIKYHAGLVNDSKTHLFNGSEMNMTKGYLPEITNHHKDIVVATNQADADRLRAAMYKELGETNKDPKDPTEFTPVMFFTEDSTKQQYVSGAMALYNYGAKGRELELDPREVIDISNVARSKTFDANWDPRQETDGSLIPLYDTNGHITGYRYEMSHLKRDTYLERNNDFSDLIGAFTSLGYTKLANKVQNEKVVDALRQDWKNAAAADRSKYVYVSYESTDPVAYAAWQRLSHDTKEYVNKTWGEYGMWVSNDAFLTVFGHPKLSMFTGAFDKDPSVRNIFEELYVTAMKGVFGERSRVAAARTERMWQEMVSLTKNFVVIRNVSTMMMNMAANTFLLLAHGVPLTDLVKNTRDSMKGGMQYRKDITLLTKLEARLRSGVGDAATTEDQINRLRHRIEANPLHDFIDAGMFAGIVEDIDPSQDMYSYQSGLQRRFENVYNKVPKLLRRTAEYAFVTPSTPLYQFLHSATQYSDFSAKYVLYKHLTETADKKLSKEEALQEASNNFINYDVPTSPALQYANDMGLVMFTKYNLRIQKALFKLIAERPAAAIGQAIAMQSITSLPPGIDPIVFNQYGNPFRDGAFGFLGVWDEPFPIKALF